MDWQKQEQHWQSVSVEDMEVAEELLQKGRARYGLFFGHLAMEKALKRLIVRDKHEMPPKIHNLLWLAEKAGIVLDQKQQKLLSGINKFQIEGRYPDMLGPAPSKVEAERIFAEMKEAWTWLLKR
jgi:HEPN domain-containing protein